MGKVHGTFNNAVVLCINIVCLYVYDALILNLNDGHTAPFCYSLLNFCTNSTNIYCVPSKYQILC